MVYVVSERPAVGLSDPMADPEVLSSEDTAKSQLALYEMWPLNPYIIQNVIAYSTPLCGTQFLGNASFRER